MKLLNSLPISKGQLKPSEISLGCMRFWSITKDQCETLVKTALDCGINYFDHADIYGTNGGCEEIFGEILLKNPSIRENMFVQTKCGIRSGYYDFSKEHIISSVENSLKRLKTDYVDALLLHRPDTLMEPDEVAEAFDILYQSGKVNHFGVSNFNPMQIKLLQKSANQKLLINQLQLSITNTGMIDSGINVNTQRDGAIDRDGSVLEYCRIEDITIQAWSPFQYGFFEGVFIDNDKFKELNDCLAKYAEQYGVTKSAIAIAWILRHPAKIQPIVGTMNQSRLIDICKASDVTLKREEWYEIYRSAGNLLP